jgi:membrane-associated phospholipid phosphatase
VEKIDLDIQPQTNSLSWLRNSISLAGLFEAYKYIVVFILKAIFICSFSIVCAFLFWRIRDWIPSVFNYSYKDYAIYLDSVLFGTVPSLWVQQNIRTEFLDIFFRKVWLSYVVVLLFGSTFAFCVRADTMRHLLSVSLTLVTGLFIHCLIPTQPPWMAVEKVIRINGDYYTMLDQNLTAAMPSIHQAIIALLGCVLWKFGLWSKVAVCSYNLLMLIALVYLGEHFVIDSLMGILLAIQSWFLSKQLFNIFINFKTITQFKTPV